ncbi:ABC transporter permease [Caldisericum exile]|uniref:Transport permease protein n=1 Tax=Caldisericum exile (strain DSM 21853 / NBRC 104410 / AZM16c01) TaxID=511051 RepID=A0A7U6GDE2_CALEA|nr:ABC transporter permease [Caldisericum exile]BAL80357.1 putative ABC transporter permease protein [Caldisericum exile AZM16c01]
MKKQIELYLRTVWARAYVRIFAQFKRDINWIISSVIGAFLTMATFIYVFRSINAPEEFSGIVLLGGFMTPYWLNVLWSVASQLYWEKEMGNLQLIVLSPASLSAFLLGLTIGGFIHTTFRALLVLFVGIVIFKIPIVVSSPFTLVFVFFISIYALYSVGMMFSALFLFYGRELWRVMVLIQDPVSIISGFYFPIKVLGTTFAAIVSAIPLTLGLDALRQILLPSYNMLFLNWKIETIILAILGSIFLFIALRMLVFIENLSKKEGRLTLKWQ